MTLRLFALACILVAAGAGREAVLRERPPVASAGTLRLFPSTLATWRSGGDTEFDGDVEQKLNADEYINRIYRDPAGRAAGLYVGYYQIQRQGSAIHSPINCLPGAGWQPVTRTEVPLDGSAGAPLVNRVIVQKGDQRQLVYYWYQSHERVTASDYWSKFYLVSDAITKRRTDTALVRIMAPLGDTAADTAVEADAHAFAALAWHAVEKTLF